MKKWLFSLLVFCGLFFIHVQTTEAATFRDVSEKHSSFAEIEFLVESGTIKGYSDGSFKPSKEVTNLQVATMIARTLELNVENRPKPGFKDVTSKLGADPYKAIAAVVDEGIFPKGEYFNPNKPITREQMAQVIVNAFGLKGKSKNVFKDVLSGNKYYNAINILTANGITTGYGDGTFKPNNTLTRAHFSTFLARVLEPDFIPVVGNYGYNKNYEYVYRYYEVDGVVGDETFKYNKSDAVGDWWIVSDQSGEGTHFQNINDKEGFVFYSPADDVFEMYVDFYIPYPVKLGSTWEFSNGTSTLPVNYYVTSMSEEVETSVGTFKDVIEIVSEDGYAYYFAPGVGHIWTFDLEYEQTVYEIISMKKK